MPRITKGNAKEHLFAAVQSFIQLTGEQVGIVLTWKGNLTVIGKEPFKEYVNEHRRDIQKSLLTTNQITIPSPLPQISSPLQPKPSPLLPVPLPSPKEKEVLDLLDSSLDLSSITMERLRKFLSTAIRNSTSKY